MNRIILVLLCFLCLNISTGSAQEAIVYQPEQMNSDLQKFKRMLIKIHPGTYTHQSPQEFNQLVNNLILETSQPLAATSFYRVVLQMIASIHDGHTQAFTFGKLGRIINNQKRFPFKVYIKNERIFVIKNLSTKEISEGSEILEINGRSSNEIINEILVHYSSDGLSTNGMLHWLAGPYKPFYRLYPEIYGEQKSYHLIYSDYISKVITSTQINAISKEVFEDRMLKKHPSKKIEEEAFNFEINELEKYAYLKINRFVKDGYDEPESTYQNFYKNCFKEISARNIQKLILDLRDNGGGKASNAAYLLQYFIDKPVTPAKEIITLGNDAYFMQITNDTLKLDEYFGLQPKENGTFKVTKSEALRDLQKYNPIEKYGYQGRLVVLINGGTTSAAGIAAGLIKEHVMATFVGEETYGYAGISNGVRQIAIKGDHTETAIYLPLLHAEYDVEEHIKNRSVVPDHQITNSVHDIINENDAIMQFVTKKLLSDF